LLIGSIEDFLLEWLRKSLERLWIYHISRLVSWPDREGVWLIFNWVQIYTSLVIANFFEHVVLITEDQDTIVSVIELQSIWEK
jgi:hypothetical protein